ncbi:hypothetical protein [Sphingopyxis macrogoltabida]|uniref:hypothetical protein n=1 Tax=Sphingopyxis macrogoltabida TaxID=33050 RepID=UPI000AA9DBE0|nr:hypothetical protein [Sphingopyxis macrogoltabida]
MTAIWMGYDDVTAAIEEQRFLLTGDAGLAASIEAWLGLSPFARTAPAQRGEEVL